MVPDCVKWSTKHLLFFLIFFKPGKPLQIQKIYSVRSFWIWMCMHVLKSCWPNPKEIQKQTLMFGQILGKVSGWKSFTTSLYLCCPKMTKHFILFFSLEDFLVRLRTFILIWFVYMYVYVNMCKYMCAYVCVYMCVYLNVCLWVYM